MAGPIARRHRCRLPLLLSGPVSTQGRSSRRTPRLRWPSLRGRFTPPPADRGPTVQRGRPTGPQEPASGQTPDNDLIRHVAAIGPGIALGPSTDCGVASRSSTHRCHQLRSGRVRDARRWLPSVSQHRRSTGGLGLIAGVVVTRWGPAGARNRPVSRRSVMSMITVTIGASMALRASPR